MNSVHDQGRSQDDRQASAAVDEWVPEDRAPSAAENNFMSFVLFAFLVLFGVSCFVLF